jgi:hypothetical protein
MIPWGEDPTWEISSLSFYCDECGYLGVSQMGHTPPSFFLFDPSIPRCQQLRVVDAIKRVYLPGQRLTQNAMERFFRTDAFFPNATPGFFDYFDDNEEESDPVAFRRAGPPPPMIAQRF